MSRNLLKQHLIRAWSRHWSLQLASVTVMTLVLVMLNALIFGFDIFNSTIHQWGQGLDVIVYFKDGVANDQIQSLQSEILKSKDFAEIRFANKTEGTKRFLQSMGPDAEELMTDPKWQSPIPDSLELRLDEKFGLMERPGVLQNWSQRLHASGVVDDVFFGQGWIENFAKFVAGAKGFIIAVWFLSLAVGLLIVSNCIRLSFVSRRHEIEVLELVGATKSFIRRPFLLEGLSLGLFAAVLSLVVSTVLHSTALKYAQNDWGFWVSLSDVRSMDFRMIVLNLMTGVVFGFWGAWNCVRKINTGWSAASR